MTIGSCISCGDYVRDMKKTRDRCQECFDELAHGKVPSVISPKFQALSSHLTPRQVAKLPATTGG